MLANSRGFGMCEVEQHILASLLNFMLWHYFICLYNICWYLFNIIPFTILFLLFKKLVKHTKMLKWAGLRQKDCSVADKWHYYLNIFSESANGIHLVFDNSWMGQVAWSSRGFTIYCRSEKREDRNNGLRNVSTLLLWKRTRDHFT